MVGDNRLSRAGVFTDPLRDEQLGQSPNEVKVDPPGALMDVTWKELKKVVKKARSGSTPGLNGIPYNMVRSKFMYEPCPTLVIVFKRLRNRNAGKRLREVLYRKKNQ